MRNMFREFWRKIKTGGHPYKASQGRKIYERIAMKTETTPDRVYKLAHGMEAEFASDVDVQEELVKYGILYKYEED